MNNPSSDQNSLMVKLCDAWRQAVLDSKIINQFEAIQDDFSGRWHKGDRIIYGIEYTDQQFVYYAYNLSQKIEIKATIEQKTIPKTGYFCTLNGYRALRPGDSHRSVGRQPNIDASPAACRFHCQDPTHPLSLLKREPLLSVQLKHFTWHAYYNAVPLQPKGHFLWIPAASSAQALPHWTQQLTPALIEDAVALFTQLSDTILYFNALHAGASVNHIHFQSVSAYAHTLPVESASTNHYRGYQLLTDCLIEPAVFTVEQSSQLIDYIEVLKQQKIPFNLAMLSDRILVISKSGDHEIVSELSNNGMAALEVCGALTVVDRATFDLLDEARLKQALQKMVVPASQIIDTIKPPIN